MQTDLFHQDAQRRTYPHLYTLNLGIGRDSLTLLALLCEGQGLRDGDRLIYARDIDAAVFSDTGAEWGHTYDLLPRVRTMCAQAGIRFVHLRKPADATWRAHVRPRGSRETPAWCLGRFASIEAKAAAGAYHLRLPIIDEYRRFAKIAVTVSASCTENHKVGPIRRLLDDLSVATFGIGTRSWGHRVRAGEAQRHRALIGIAADEAERAINTGRPDYEWAVYPLLEMGITKAMEATILDRNGLGAVRKSGCFMCPYQPVGWYWVLRETDPDRWQQVVDYEAAAMASNPKMVVVGGSKRTLPEAVEAWRARNPDATVEEVLDKSYTRCAPAMGRDSGATELVDAGRVAA